MADVINLNKARKAKTKAAGKQAAAENRQPLRNTGVATPLIATDVPAVSARVADFGAIGRVANGSRPWRGAARPASRPRSLSA